MSSPSPTQPATAAAPRQRSSGWAVLAWGCGLGCFGFVLTTAFGGYALVRWAGSTTPLPTEELLLTPHVAAYAVVSSGRHFGRTVLREWVLERYRARGVAIYRTDWHGGVRLTTPNGALHVEGARAMRDYPIRTTP